MHKACFIIIINVTQAALNRFRSFNYVEEFINGTDPQKFVDYKVK